MKYATRYVLLDKDTYDRVISTSNVANQKNLASSDVRADPLKESGPLGDIKQGLSDLRSAADSRRIDGDSGTARALDYGELMTRYLADLDRLKGSRRGHAVVNEPNVVRPDREVREYPYVLGARGRYFPDYTDDGDRYVSEGEDRDDAQRLRRGQSPTRHRREQWDAERETSDRGRRQKS